MKTELYFKIGCIFFAAAFLGLGVLHVIAGHSADEILPVTMIPAGTFFPYLIGIAMIAAGVLILTKKYMLTGALLGAGIFAIFLLLQQIPLLLKNLHASGNWTPTSESFMFFSGSLMVAGSIIINQKHSRRGQWVFTIGKYIFALTLLDFSIEHFVSEKEVLTFMPTWIPWKDFWAYLVMCAFFLAFLSIITKIQERLSALLLFLMFFIWVCILHTPDVLRNMRSEFSWDNWFVPIGVCGIALILRASYAHEFKRG